MDKSEKLPKSFAQKVRAIPGSDGSPAGRGEHLEMCYSCGTCVSRCMIQQKVEPGYNPRRLIRKVMMGLDQDACKDKTTWLCSACDLCYPACPQKIHISEVIGAIKCLAIEAGHTSPLKIAVVNEQTCVACGLCVEVCPYEAVTLQPLPISRTGGKELVVARVNASRCMACGLCAASCRSASIGLPDEFSNESLIEELWKWVKSPVFEEVDAGNTVDAGEEEK